jgi:hypothetical protein
MVDVVGCYQLSNWYTLNQSMMLLLIRAPTLSLSLLGDTVGWYRLSHGYTVNQSMMLLLILAPSLSEIPSIVVSLSNLSVRLPLGVWIFPGGYRCKLFVSLLLVVRMMAAAEPSCYHVAFLLAVRRRPHRFTEEFERNDTA